MNQFIGTWTLLDNQIKAIKKGKRQENDFKEGCISYDPSGMMAVQLMSSKHVPESDPLATYFAYYGRYTVDLDLKVITHHIIGSLDALAIGKDVPRQYRFKDENTLILEVIKPETYSSVTYSGYLSWKRCS